LSPIGFAMMLPSHYRLGLVSNTVRSVKTLEVCPNRTDGNIQVGSDLFVCPAAQR
jgi:hypothetical protein